MILLLGGVAFALCVIYVPQTQSVPIPVPQSSVQSQTVEAAVTAYVIGPNIEYKIPVGSYQAAYTQLAGGTTLNIYASTMEPLDFYVMDQTNFQQYSQGSSSSAPLIAHIGLQYSTTWTVPYSATWYFVFDDKQPINFNKVVLVTVSYVTVQPQVQYVTRYYYVNQTIQVTVNRPILPANDGQPAAGVVIVGAAILALGILHNEPQVQESKRRRARS